MGGGGAGNIVGEPQFFNALGADGVAGTEDDDLRLLPTSPCIDAGDTTALPADQFDLDGDGDVTEPLPIDMLGNRRAMNLPSAPNVGVTSPAWGGRIVDMGAFEYRRPADIVPATVPLGDGVVGVAELLMVLTSWGPVRPQIHPAPRPAPRPARSPRSPRQSRGLMGAQRTSLVMAS